MTTRQLTVEERRVVRRCFRQCTFPWPADFLRPFVEAEPMSRFGHLDYHRNVVVLNEQVIRLAAAGDGPRLRQAKATLLHETFHGLDYQCLDNEGRRKLTTVLHGGVEHIHAPADTEHPWADARDEEKWTDHGHAWWDSKYEESLMEACADAFVQTFSDLTSQTAGRWVHPTTPEIEANFKKVCVEVTR